MSQMGTLRKLEHSTQTTKLPPAPQKNNNNKERMSEIYKMLKLYFVDELAPLFIPLISLWSSLLPDLCVQQPKN